MAATKITQRAGTPDDIERLIDVFLASFATNLPAARTFPPHAPETRDFWRRNLAAAFADAHVSCRVVEAAVPETDAAAGAAGAARPPIIAFALWHRPRPADAPFSAMPPGPEGFPAAGDREGAAVFFADLERQHRRIMADARTGRPLPHWYLELIATHPDHQGRGAGGALLRWGEQQADAQGVACYLDATPAGRAVYTSAGHGFREVGARQYYGGAYEQVFMVRDPRPAVADETGA